MQQFALRMHHWQVPQQFLLRRAAICYLLVCFLFLPSFNQYSENGCVDASLASSKDKQQHGAWGRAPLTVSNCRPGCAAAIGHLGFEWKPPTQVFSPLCSMPVCFACSFCACSPVSDVRCKSAACLGTMHCITAMSDHN